MSKFGHKITVALIVLAVVGILVWLITQPRKAPKPKPDSGFCSVVQFNVEGQKPVCAIRCSYYRGHNGYESMVGVPCSYMGAPVQMVARSPSRGTGPRGTRW